MSASLAAVSRLETRPRLVVAGAPVRAGARDARELLERTGERVRSPRGRSSRSRRQRRRPRPGVPVAATGRSHAIASRMTVAPGDVDVRLERDGDDGCARVEAPKLGVAEAHDPSADLVRNVDRKLGDQLQPDGSTATKSEHGLDEEAVVAVPVVADADHEIDLGLGPLGSARSAHRCRGCGGDGASTMGRPAPRGPQLLLGVGPTAPARRAASRVKTGPSARHGVAVPQNVPMATGGSPGTGCARRAGTPVARPSRRQGRTGGGGGRGASRRPRSLPLALLPTPPRARRGGELSAPDRSSSSKP